jgi:hypothetical protein
MSDARFGGFTVRVDCRQCGQPIPLNAIEPSVHCDHCQNDGALPRELWRAVLRDFDENDQLPRADETASKTVELGGWIAHFAHRRASPACEKCGAPYPPERISGHDAVDFFCVACGDPASTYPRPAWLSTEVRTARQIILTEPRGPALHANGAVNGGVNGGAVAVPDAPRPVLMLCPGCGGPLSVGAQSPRTTRCGHCTADVYLPDDLWRRLHPAKTMREWFVRFEGATDREREEEARREATAKQEAMRERHRAEAREESERRAAAARVAADEQARVREVELRRAMRGAYLGVVPLVATIATVVATFGVAGALDVELPSEAVFVVGAIQLAFAALAAFKTAKPIQQSLRADGSHMMAYHWIWVIFSFFVFPFGPILFFVGLKRFTGSFSAAVISDSSGRHHIAAAKLTRRESWPAALFFLAMSLGVAGEVAARFAYTQGRAVETRRPSSKRAR